MDNLRYSVANEVGKQSRAQLFSFPAIILFFLLVAAGLIALFPGESLVTMLSKTSFISDVEIRYALLILAKNNPAPLRHQDLENQPLSALHTLTEGLSNTPTGLLWAKYLLVKTVLFNNKHSKDIHAKAVEAMKQFHAELSRRPRTLKQNLLLAGDALAINDSANALAFYRQIIAEEPNQTVYFYENAAKVALWANQCVQSSQYYFTAQGIALSLEDKRYLYIHALKVLFQCNRYDLAMDLALEHMGDLRNDELTYQILTDLALKADQPAKAREFVLKLLQLKESY